MDSLSQMLRDFTELFFPELCIICGNRLVSQEKYVCMKCWFDLPVTRFGDDQYNKTAQLFWGRVQIEHTVSWFHYKKGSRYQELIHAVKYKGLKELGLLAGRKFGETLVESGAFDTVNLIIPVPLHKRKLRKRGFNQSEWIARGISEALEKPISAGNLYRKIHSQTQTRKNRFERWLNVEEIFDVKDATQFENQHILLVDDVVTTGSTLEACAFELLKIPGVKVSIATLASTT